MERRSVTLALSPVLELVFGQPQDQCLHNANRGLAGCPSFRFIQALRALGLGPVPLSFLHS
jgi:hypothetical protein